jgi:hypothetical protein
VEIKSSPADFHADRKWRDFVACYDRLHFAISERTPAELMPVDAGLILADPYGAEILPEADLRRMPPTRRRALQLGFAQAAADAVVGSVMLPTFCTNTGVALAAVMPQARRAVTVPSTEDDPGFSPGRRARRRHPIWRPERRRRRWRQLSRRRV